MREIKDDIKVIKENLRRVGFKDVERVLDSYPHNLSGGMKQRVLIAMALLGGEILIADEFTSALDRTTKLQVVELFNELNKKLKTTIIFITHDIELLNYSGFLMVMFKGEIVEYGNVEDLKNSPMHPYMEFLLACLPTDDMHYTKDRFKEITINKDAKCPFVEICKKADKICFDEKPELKEKNGRLIRCHF
jgi:oligopeptide/dipeptide ABC transporter ATP-binding protein